MTYVIDLPLPVQARIEEEARKAGVSAAELLADVVRRNFGMTVDSEEQKQLNAPSIALLNSWLAEAEKPRTAAETEEAEEDMKELMRSLNASRRLTGERLHFPDITEKA